ncbi:MAG: hydrolase [Devosia sp.]|nr:hydrolase [Devosia sp.]
MSERIKNVQVETLARHWGTLTQASFEYQRSDGTWQRQVRECYDHGHGAAILLFEPVQRTVILVRQFRYPAFAAGEPAFLVEVCAGLVDDDPAPVAAVREALEETGLRPHGVEHMFEAFMSPGSLQEKVSCFLGLYDAATPPEGGGGLAEEGEDIEILELPLEDALAMIGRGEIMDGKTIMMLQWLALNRP